MYEQRRDSLNLLNHVILQAVEHWSETLTCPVIQVDGTKDILENAKLIKEEYLKILSL